MNKDAIAWLNSSESDRWRRKTFRKLYALVSVKDDTAPTDYVAFLWDA